MTPAGNHIPVTTVMGEAPTNTVVDPSLISIVVPSYNRADLVRRCYDSVVAQAPRPLEFLLADDASTDDTATVAAALPPASGVTVRYLRQPSNQGVSAARNMAVRAARGGLVAFLDSDDVWFPNHLEELLRALNAANADVVFSRAEIRENPDAPPSGRSDFGPIPGELANLPECLYYFNFVLPSVTMVRRSFFEKVGYFDEDPLIQHAEDWDIFVRAVQAGLKFEHVPQATACYVVPVRVPPVKQFMMIRRALYCLEKHRDHRHTPAWRRRLTRDYYRVWLATLMGPEEAEAQQHLRRVLRGAWWRPLAGLPSLCGLLIPGLPSFLRPYGHRLYARLVGRLRAVHRQLRGFPNPRD